MRLMRCSAADAASGDASSALHEARRAALAICLAHEEPASGVRAADVAAAEHADAGAVVILTCDDGADTEEEDGGDDGGDDGGEEEEEGARREATSSGSHALR